MQITRRPDIERVLLDAIIESFGKPLPEFTRKAEEVRVGIHLSDLLSPRQTYWKRQIPLPPTDVEALYFLAGRGHEDVLGRVTGLQEGERKIHDGISYTPDFDATLAEFVGVPAEFKTRRSNLAKEGEEAVEYRRYLDQLGGYCSFRGSLDGLLLVLSLLEGRSGDPLKPTQPELAAYHVRYTVGELADIGRALLDKRDRLVAALATKNGDALPLCEPWLCGKAVKTITAKPYCLTCRREFASEYGIGQHLAGKAGDGHEVKHEEVKWEYVPRCKWYVFCQPQTVDPTRGAR